VNAPYRAHADPPKTLTLTDRLRRLNDNLQRLAARLKDSIAAAIGKTVAEAVKDGVSDLLGVEDEPEPRRDAYPGGYGHGRHWEEGDDYGRYGGDPWRYQDEDPPPLPKPGRGDGRWKEAVRAAMQTALWWLRRQPTRRPMLTTTLVALAAGSAALVAGPTLVACVSVAASVVSLLLTAESTGTAAELIADG